MTVIDTAEAIKTAYRELRRAGYFCRSAFTCCSTCAWAEVPGGRAAKVVFYHRQDAADLRREGGCYLAWSGDGEFICAALRRAGLHVTWDGEASTRIFVSNRRTLNPG